MKKKIKIERPIIRVDWEFLQENSSNMPKRIEKMWEQLMRNSVQRQIYELRQSWDIPAFNGHPYQRGIPHSPMKETDSGLVTLEQDVLKMMEANQMPPEYVELMRYFVVFGFTMIEKESATQRKRSLVMQEEGRLKQALKWQDIADVPYRSSLQSKRGSTLMHMDMNGKIIIEFDPEASTQELRDMIDVVEQWKKVLNIKTKKSLKSSNKNDESFLLRTLIYQSILENPEADNETLMAKAQSKFNEIFRTKRSKSMKSISGDYKSQKFMKDVQRVRKLAAS